jgi:hypothetical protein
MLSRIKVIKNLLNEDETFFTGVNRDLIICKTNMQID